MANFLKTPNEKLLFRVLPKFFMELLTDYFRLKVEGAENIPRKGPVIIAPNHSGYLGLDAMLVSHIVETHGRRRAKVLTHHFWFLSETTALPAHKLGFEEATYENAIRLLKQNRLIILFPEGETGNFKPTTQKYQLQEFKRGFVRMALETQAKIVPALVIGAEESQINLSQIKFTKFLRGLMIPLPLNFIPLPTRWKIVFMPPVELNYKRNQVNNTELVHSLTEDIQDDMQEALTKVTRNRKRIF